MGIGIHYLISGLHYPLVFLLMAYYKNWWDYDNTNPIKKKRKKKRKWANNKSIFDFNKKKKKKKQNLELIKGRNQIKSNLLQVNEICSKLTLNWWDSSHNTCIATNAPPLFYALFLHIYIYIYKVWVYLYIIWFKDLNTQI